MTQMRTFMNLVEDRLQNAVTPLRSEWNDEMLRRAQDTSRIGFEPLKPSLTGLDVTVYASESPQCPAVIFNTVVGDHAVPQAGAHVVRLGERIDDPQIGPWLAANTETLELYASGEYDTSDLLASLKPTGSHTRSPCA